MSWIFGIAIGITIGYLLDREIYFYEGTHLGPRAQAWLYDRWSRKYDKGKRESQLRDEEMLARPLLGLLKEIPEPFILDFATGTGRLSFVLLNQADFNGHIIALDLSQGMLEQASEKLAPRAERRDGDPPSRRRSAGVEFLRHLALPLPFHDSTFDAVCALEVLELFPAMDEPLSLKQTDCAMLRSQPGGSCLTACWREAIVGGITVWGARTDRMGGRGGRINLSIARGSRCLSYEKLAGPKGLPIFCFVI